MAPDTGQSRPAATSQTNSRQPTSSYTTSQQNGGERPPAPSRQTTRPPPVQRSGTGISGYPPPHYSLAGNGTSQQRDTYVDPEYRAYNAQYGKQQDKPIWGLAKPLPRVVRPGMRRDNRPSGTEAIGGQENGQTQPAPQVGNTPARHNRQRSGTGRTWSATAKPMRMDTRRNPPSVQSRVSAYPNVAEEPENDHLNLQTPGSERPDPMEAISKERKSSSHDWTQREGSDRVERPVQTEPNEDMARGALDEQTGHPQSYGYGPEPENEGWGNQPPMEEIEEGAGDEEFLNFWSKIRHKFREPIAEWLGTSVTVLVGTCGSLSVATSAGQAGTFESMNWSWGFGVMLGIYIAGGVSGAHLNPAISIVLSIFRGFPFRRCIVYIAAQIIGAITGAGIAFALYKDAILHLDHALIPESTGIALYTQPKPWVTPATGFFNEYVATAILACSVFALGDDTNAPPGAGMHSFIIGLIVTVLCMTFGYNTGGCFNPARDFGPRLVALMAGYGSESFLASQNWWLWGGWVATIAGAIAGGGMYDIVIFVGGESPVNYPRKRRRRAMLKIQARWWKRFGFHREKIEDVENEIKKDEP